jgi:RHS repeat-associated protein
VESGEGVGQRVYIGQVYDQPTELQYLNARYYDPALGRFGSLDPLLRGVPTTALLGSPQSLNFYAYSSNNPINKSDPSGLFSITNGVVNNMVVQGDTARSIAGILNNAYAAQ